jgi:hypothetical protein
MQLAGGALGFGVVRALYPQHAGRAGTAARPDPGADGRGDVTG